jgi:hypothetical protein
MLERFLSGHAVRYIAVLVALAIASAATIGSGAVFTTSTANVGNVFAAGSLKSTNTGVAYNLANRVPGDRATGDVTLTNTGTVKGDFSLTRTSTAETAGSDPESPSTGSGLLSNGAVLTVTDTTSTPGVSIFSGAPSAFGTRSIGTMNAGAVRTLHFDITLPNTALGAQPAISPNDNKYEGAVLSDTYTFTARTT